jgi:hypothetical protein
LIALRRLPRRVLLGLVVAGAIASAGFRLWCFLAAEAGPGVMFGTISLPARADGLLVGAAVAIMVTSDMLPKSPRGLSALRWISGLAGCRWSACFCSSPVSGQASITGRTRSPEY